MIQSKLLDNFRIRTPQEGFIRFTKNIHKWQMLYLDIKDNSQIHFNVKGRQVGLSSFYKFLAMYYFMSNHRPYDITYYAPTYAMHDPKLIQMNVNMLDINVEKNQRYMLERSVGNRVFLETISKSAQSSRRSDIMFVDEIFQIDNKRQLLEDLIEHTLRKPERKLFVGGSLSLDFKEDAKFVKHINKLPVNMERNFIINERTNMKLNKFLAIGSDRAVYDYRPDVLFDILEDEYSTNFEILG